MSTPSQPKGPNPIPPVAIVKNVVSGDQMGPSTSGKMPSNKNSSRGSAGK